MCSKVQKGAEEWVCRAICNGEIMVRTKSHGGNGSHYDLVNC